MTKSLGDVQNPKITRKITEKVLFKGCSECQKQFGNNDGDTSKLTVGSEYEVLRTEAHNWHTKIYLKGFEGSFNSVCFKLVLEE